jgi:DNA-binding transcriptional regulator YdaS (Cro superfamily)
MMKKTGSPKIAKRAALSPFQSHLSSMKTADLLRVAQLIGVSRSTVFRWKAGESRIPATRAPVLRRAIGTVLAGKRA